MKWTELLSHKRFGKEDSHKVLSERRTEFQRDYDRLIFSPAFRRLQNKTQVFPLPGSIFVHNRLTHSLEVASVGRSLGTDIADELLVRHPELADTPITAIGSIVSAACLAHDMGNPPFGHSGERAIRSFFAEGPGQRFKDYVTPDGQKLTPEQWSDLIHFDGNANTLRLLTHQFNGRRKGGFVMTYATLASVVKYPFSSLVGAKKSKFGFFDSERATYECLAQELGIPQLETIDGEVRYARHPLVYLVEAADDICYEIMDIEDAHKLRLLSDEETLSLFLGFFDEAEQEAIMKPYAGQIDVDDQIVYLRSCVINALERACVEIFVDHEEEILAGTLQGSLIDHLPKRLNDAYKHCEKVAVRKIYQSRSVTDIDLSGYRIIYTLIELLTDAVTHPEKAYSELILKQVSAQYQVLSPVFSERMMAVLDYISGMTDVYALNLYRKINGHSLPMV
jgi:dGTPase